MHTQVTVTWPDELLSENLTRKTTFRSQNPSPEC